VAVVARAIVLVASLVFLVIVLGILLVVLDANPQNAIVQLVTGAASFLVGPFDGLFTLRDAQLETAINWGIAAFFWLIVGVLVAGLLRRIAPRGRRRGRKT
jgi:membrane-bound ClpP family serine protease